MITATVIRISWKAPGPASTAESRNRVSFPVVALAWKPDPKQHKVLLVSQQVAQTVGAKFKEVYGHE